MLKPVNQYKTILIIARRRIRKRTFSTTTPCVYLHPSNHCSTDLDPRRNHKRICVSELVAPSSGRDLEHFKDDAVCPCVHTAPLLSEYGFHSQLHKHRTRPQLDGTGLRWPDTNRGFLTLGGAAWLLQDQQSYTPDPHSHSDSASVCCPLLGCQHATLTRGCRALTETRWKQNRATATASLVNNKHGRLSEETADFGGKPKPVVEWRRLNRISNMSWAQRAPWDKTQECHHRHSSTIARQLFVTQQEGSLAWGNTRSTPTRGNMKMCSSILLNTWRNTGRTALLNTAQLQQSAKTSAFKKGLL